MGEVDHVNPHLLERTTQCKVVCEDQQSVPCDAGNRSIRQAKADELVAPHELPGLALPLIVEFDFLREQAPKPADSLSLESAGQVTDFGEDVWRGNDPVEEANESVQDVELVGLIALGVGEPGECQPVVPADQEHDQEAGIDQDATPGMLLHQTLEMLVELPVHRHRIRRCGS